MAHAIATVGGVALAPGVSLNRRWYTREMIASAVARAQARIAGGDALTVVDRRESKTGATAAARPLTQLTHHEAGDDSTRIVGRLTSVHLDEHGRIRYTAAIADTAAGRDIAALVDTSDGQPAFLTGVSIRGAFTGKVREVTGPDGKPATTADGLELDGLDYTATPGVPEAGVDTFAWAGGKPPAESADGRVLIHESVQEARVTFTETTSDPDAPPATEQAAPAGPPADVAEAARALLPLQEVHVLEDGTCVTCEAARPMSKRSGGLSGAGGPYADPGYLKDGKQRYQLDTKAHARAAWSYINMPRNARQYTAAQLKRVKGRIMKALRKFGVKTAAEGWTIEPAVQVSEAVAEYYGGDPKRAGSWSVNASNGPVNINLSSYCMDPADLDVILRAAADAACKALAALDPDMDGDVDVPGASSGDTDHDMPSESVPAPPAAEAAPAGGPDDDPAPAGKAQESGPAPAGHPTGRGTPMGESTSTQAAGTEPAATGPMITAEAIGAAVAKGIGEAFAARDRAAEEAAEAQRKAEKKKAKEARKRDRKRGTTETAGGGQPADEQRIEQLAQARLQEMIARGEVTPGRAGLTPKAGKKGATTPPTVNENGLPATWPDKPLHEYSAEEFDQYAGAATDHYVMGDRAATELP